MYTIKAKQLTAEAFRKYGTYQNLLDNEEMKKNSIFPENFFADLVTLDFGTSTFWRHISLPVKGCFLWTAM